MGDFQYKVKNGDKGLSYIFLEQAKAEGFKEKSVDWNKVMSVFDEIQKEEKSKGESLFVGGTDKTKAGWRTSYIIRPGDKIELDESQMNKIYEAMGFKKEPAPKAEEEPVIEMSAPKANAPASETAELPAPEVKEPPASETAELPTPEVNEPPISEAKKKEFEDAKAHYDKAKGKGAATAQDLDTRLSTEIDYKLAKLREQKNSSATTAAKETPATTNKGTPIPITFKPAIKESAVPAKNPATEAKSDKASTSAENASESVHTISTSNIDGAYKITANENGNGFEVLQNINMTGQSAISEFFQKAPSYNEVAGEYSIRGVKGKDKAGVKLEAEMEARTLSINNAIYLDLAKKKASGTKLSKAEISFMESHIKKLQENGLQLNDKNELIEIPEAFANKDSEANRKAWGL